MAAEIFLVTILLIAFTIIVAVICLFLLIQLLRADKEARPFLISLFFYFLLLCVANSLQVVYNILNYDILVAPSYDITFYTTFFVFLLTLAAPIYLIYQIEKIFFQSKILAKYHTFSLLNLILYIAFLGIVSFQAFNDISVITEFNFINYIFVAGALLGLQILFVICAFFYLGIKSTGRYRLYAIFIALGWLANYAANTLATLVTTLTPTVILALFIPKLIGVVLTAIGLYKFYALKIE